MARTKPRRKPSRPARKSKAATRKTARKSKKAIRRPKARVKAKKAVRKARAKRQVRRAARKTSVRSKKAGARRTAAPTRTSGNRPARKPSRPVDKAESREGPILNRIRRLLADEERLTASAHSGHDAMRAEISKHTETSPVLTAGDVDARWQDAYAVGDEAPGGDNPTPDQDRVDDIGRALGIEYQDGEELKGGEEVLERDRHRWEMDPASSDDWPHDKK